MSKQPRTERDLLALLCHFITTKQFIAGDEASIKDMVTRYKEPPFTLLFPVAIRLTVKDTDQLNELLKEAHELLSAQQGDASNVITDSIDHRAGDVSPDAARLERGGSI